MQQARHLRIWDVDSGEEKVSLKGHTGPVMSVAISADGKRLATGSIDKTVKVWDVAMGAERFTLNSHAHAVWSRRIVYTCIRPCQPETPTKTKTRPPVDNPSRRGSNSSSLARRGLDRVPGIGIIGPAPQYCAGAGCLNH
jgi:hypothetical protein